MSAAELDAEGVVGCVVLAVNETVGSYDDTSLGEARYDAEALKLWLCVEVDVSVADGVALSDSLAICVSVAAWLSVDTWLADGDCVGVVTCV